MDKARITCVSQLSWTCPDFSPVVVDARWDAEVSSACPPPRERLTIDGPMKLTLGDVPDPYVIALVNVTGANLKEIPDAHVRAGIEWGAVLVLLTHRPDTPDPHSDPEWWDGAQILPPPRVLSGQSPWIPLRPMPGGFVHVRPLHVGATATLVVTVVRE